MVSKKDSIDIKKIIGHKFEPCYQKITANDCILYALSVGFNEGGLNKDHFKYTYENDDNF